MVMVFDLALGSLETHWNIANVSMQSLTPNTHTPVVQFDLHVARPENQDCVLCCTLQELEELATHAFAKPA